MSRKKRKKVKSPVIFQTLSEAPDGSLGKRAAYHGARVLLLVLLAAGITFLFPTLVRETAGLPGLGEVAPEDVVAEVDFQIPRDSAEVARDQADAEASVPPVFRELPETRDSVEADLNGFFDRVQEAAEGGGRPQVEQVLRFAGLELLVPQAEFFLNPSDLEALREACLSVVRQLAPTYLGSDRADEVVAAGALNLMRPDGSIQVMDAERFLWGLAFNNEVREALADRTPEFQSIAGDLITRFLVPQYGFDAGQTETFRLRRRSAVPTTEGDPITVGDVFIRQGDRISPQDLRALREHLRLRQEAGLVREQGWDWASTFGSFLINLLLLGVFGVLLFFFRPEVYGSFRWLFLLTFLAAAYFLVAAGISFQEEPLWQLLPVAFVVLPVAILWDGRMALILALVLGVLTGAQEPFNNYQVLAFTVMGGAAAALSARAVRRRSQTWIFIALITLCYALVLAAFGLKGEDPADVLLSIVYAGSNATVSAILAMGFMPVFEWFTGITTDQTLLEWADPNRPLLKSLSLEASGTYAHTINVANLAEAAATAIGANGLLTRVGIYYHDVGKMLKPQYFVENQPGGRNPHDKLKPQTSAAIVREHVVEGEKMARDEGVPDVIARFIPEHHGTQLIGFFYDKAKEESQGELDEEEFRYPGPKPRSKETAISMLADSVESAARVLQDPSPERVRELVRTVVDGKIRDGQLSDAPLTLREIGLIEEQFVKVVRGMSHHRLDYPATKHLTDSPKGTESAEAAGPEAKAEGAGPKQEQLAFTGADEPDATPGGEADSESGLPAAPDPEGRTHGE